jgi:hypothetical protein
MTQRKREVTGPAAWAVMRALIIAPHHDAK